MIPYVNGAIQNIVSADSVSLPGKTYYIDFEAGRIKERIDEIEAVKQAVFCRLSTEKGAYNIYSESYGLPLSEFITQSAPFIYVSVADSIRKTLTEDDRIIDVSDFAFDTDRKFITVSFKVLTIYGTVDINEVSINV